MHQSSLLPPNQDAAKRETKEESGHEIEPRALIAVEFNSSTWIRFSFAGEFYCACDCRYPAYLIALRSGDWWAAQDTS